MAYKSKTEIEEQSREGLTRSSSRLSRQPTFRWWSYSRLSRQQPSCDEVTVDLVDNKSLGDEVTVDLIDINLSGGEVTVE